MRISPPPSLFKVVVPVRVMGLAKEMLLLLAWMSPERETVPPAPLSVKGPERRVEPPATRFKSPVWVMAQGPLLVEISEPVIEKLVPLKTMPATPFVLRFPAIVVKPAPVV